MSSSLTNGVGRSDRPADIDTAKKPPKPTTASLLPTPVTGKRVALKPDPPSSDLSDPPDGDADDELKDKDLSSVSIQGIYLRKRPTLLVDSHGTC
jgi:hypothetical protein